MYPKGERSAIRKQERLERKGQDSADRKSSAL